MVIKQERLTMHKYVLFNVFTWHKKITWNTTKSIWCIITRDVLMNTYNRNILKSASFFLHLWSNHQKYRLSDCCLWGLKKCWRRIFEWLYYTVTMEAVGKDILYLSIFKPISVFVTAQLYMQCHIFSSLLLSGLFVWLHCHI